MSRAAIAARAKIGDFFPGTAIDATTASDRAIFHRFIAHHRASSSLSSIPPEHCSAAQNTTVTVRLPQPRPIRRDFSRDSGKFGPRVGPSALDDSSLFYRVFNDLTHYGPVSWRFRKVRVKFKKGLHCLSKTASIVSIYKHMPSRITPAGFVHKLKWLHDPECVFTRPSVKHQFN